MVWGSSLLVLFGMNGITMGLAVNADFINDVLWGWGR